MFSRILSTIGTSAFVFAFLYEGLLGLGANLESNRALLEERVRLSHTTPTATTEEVELRVDKNMSALDAFNATLKTEYKAFGCNAEKPCR